MDKNLPSKGDIVRLKFENEMVSYFLEVKLITNDMILLTKPANKENIKIGAKVYLKYPGENGLMEMSSETIDFGGHGSELLPIKNNINSVQLLERRRFFRVNINVPIKYKKIDRERFRKHYTHNISGGGIAIIDIFNELSLNDTINILLNIPTLKEEIELTGKVVRIAPGISGYNEAGIMFMDITDEQRKNIVLYISQFSESW